MRFFSTRQDSFAVLRAAFDSRLSPATDSVEAAVRGILAAVCERGDEAVLELTQRFDFPQASTLRVAEAAIDAAVARVRATELWPVLQLAAERIRAFHMRQVKQSWMDTSQPGEILGQIVRPLGRVGVYVPGGTAAYPSTVLMAAIPALVAGVPSVALATPPNHETGLPPDATLAAAQVAGVTEVYAMGGAQAIGALAYGTQSIERVDKVVGPGNLYVNLAKRLVYGTVGIDMLAGPSEIAVLADDTADPAIAAADILAQCEHDTHCSALVVTPSEAWAQRLMGEIECQLETLPRAEIVRRALEANGFVVITRDVSEAALVVSLYAPEHLHIVTADPWGILSRIENAGAILIGPHTSAAIGDYLAGPCHTLPTAGCARFSSPLHVDDFMKKSSVLYFDHAAAAALSPAAQVFATFEGLEAHARAAAVSSR